MKKFFKVIIFIAILAVSFFLIFNSFFSIKSLFKYNVINPIPQSVVDIKYYKDKSATHGPIIFSFSANDNDTEKIIKINNLLEHEEIPHVFRSSLHRFSDIGWWKSLSELEKMKIYGKLTENEYDWNALFIFIDDTNTRYVIKY